MKLKIGCAVFLLFFGTVCMSAIVAYRTDNSMLYVVPDESNQEKIFEIDRVTSTYQVGYDIIAYKNGSDLYIASKLSNWKPLFVSRDISSFEVQWSTVMFRKDDSLYVVRHPAPDIAFGDLISKKIRDFSLFSNDKEFSRQMITPYSY